MHGIARPAVNVCTSLISPAKCTYSEVTVLKHLLFYCCEVVTRDRTMERS